MNLRSPLLFPLLSAALFLPSAALAAGATITIEQVSDVEALGTWTLSFPNQETLERTDAQLTFTEAAIGQYTLFIEPPEGELASVDIIRNDALETTIPRPQASFAVAEGDVVRLVVKHTLTNFGRIGVNSYPSGVKFELVGPNAIKEVGITPMTYERMPVGNYSVQYKPTGCKTPPGKSDVLKKDGAVYFSIEFQCSTFVPEEGAQDPTHISTEVKGNTVMFTDVPVEAWFAAYVDTVSKRGILTGYKDASGQSTGEFGPQNPVTVAELAKIIHEMADVDELRVDTPPRNEAAVGKWFTKYIASAEERGWALYQNTQLDLVRPASRGEVLVTLLQILDIPLQWGKGKTFTDVTVRTPYAHAIETAAAEGIVSGVTDADGNPTGEFHPEQPITRAEMAKILITVQEKYYAEGLGQ